MSDNQKPKDGQERLALADQNEGTPSSGFFSRIAGATRERYGRLFGHTMDKRRPAPRLGNGFEKLEPRMMLSATPAEVSYLEAEDIDWATGRNDAEHILGSVNAVPGSNMYDVSINPQGTLAAVGGQYGKLSIVDISTGNVVMAVPGNGGSVIDTAWSPDGSALFAASYDNHVREYRTSDWSLAWDSGGLGQLAVGVSVTPDGQSLLICRHEIAPLTVSLPNHAIRTMSSSFGMIGEMMTVDNEHALLLQNDMAYRGSNNRVILADIATGQALWTGSLSGLQPTNIAVTDDGIHIFAGMDDGSIVMFDRETGTRTNVAGASSYIRDMTLDETGTVLLTSSGDGLRMYDVKPAEDGTGNASLLSQYETGMSRLALSGSVLLANNARDGAGSRVLAFDLGDVPVIAERLATFIAETTAAPEPAPEPTSDPSAPENEPVSHDLSIDFDVFGRGTHPDTRLSASIDSRLAPIVFDGDGGVVIGDDGSITSLAGGRDRGDWGLQLDGYSIGSVTVTVSGDGRYTPKLHVIAGGEHRYIELVQGTQTINLNADDVTHIGGMCGDHRIVLNDVTMTLPEELWGTEDVDPETALHERLLAALGSAGIDPADVADLSEASLRALFGITPDFVPGSAHLSATVSGTERGILTVDSPYDDTYIVTPHGTEHVSHPGGAHGLVVWNNYLHTLANLNLPEPTVEMKLYADKGQTVLLDRVVFGYNRSNGAFSTETSPRTTEQPEQWTDPELQVIRTSGATVTVAYGTPFEDAVIEIEGGGRFSSTSVDGDSPIAFGTATIALDGALPSGAYSVRLLDRVNGLILKEITLLWDAEARTLTPEDGLGEFSPFSTVALDPNDVEGSLEDARSMEGAEEAAVRATIEAERFLDQFGGAVQTNVPDTPDGRAIIESQRWNLLDLAKSSGHEMFLTRDQLWALFTRPGSQWASRTFATDAESNEFSYVRSAEFAPYGPAMDAFNSALGRMMESAMNVVLKARRGESYSADLSNIHTAATDPIYGHSFSLLSGLGIAFPSAEDCIAACRDILTLQASAYAEMLRSAYQSAVHALNLMNDAGYAGSGAATPPSSSGGFNLQAWEGAMRQAAADTATYLQSIGEEVPVSAFTVLETTQETDDEESVLRLGSIDDSVTQLRTLTENGDRILLASIDELDRVSGKAAINGRIVTPQEVGGVIDLGTAHEILMPNYELLLSPHQSKSFTFTLTEDSMVNLFTRGVALHDVKLRISGGAIGEGYSSDKSHMNGGESISLRLTAGTYTFTVEAMPPSYEMTQETPFLVSTAISVKEYNSANIEGKISIDGDPRVMDVSLRVAEFVTDASGKTSRNRNYDGKDVTIKQVDQLNSNLPVWVVIHGRNDSEDSGKMIDLEKALTASGYQVVSLNWRNAADSILAGGEKWIEAVAQWSYRALVSAGISGDKIHIAGHSWGSFVGYEIAERFRDANGFGVDTFVALDSAVDPTLPVNYDAAQVDFSSVSRSSTAFWSSLWGSEGRALTADHTIELRSDMVSAELLTNSILQHGMAVTTFANLLRLQRLDPSNEIASLFSWDSTESSGLPERNGIDAWIQLSTWEEFGSELGDKYIDAIPSTMTLTDPDDDVSDVTLINDIMRLQ